MITFDKFQILVGSLKEFNETLDELNSKYHIPLYETFIDSAIYKIFDTAISIIFKSEGEDLIFWWLYENVEKVIYDNEEAINVEDIEDLYNYIAEHKDIYVNE